MSYCIPRRTKEVILKYINSISRADCEGNPIHLASPEGRKDVKYDLVSAAGCACVYVVCVHTCVHAWYFTAQTVWHIST